jgi:hypothetical protein
METGGTAIEFGIAKPCPSETMSQILSANAAAFLCDLCGKKLSTAEYAE